MAAVSLVGRARSSTPPRTSLGKVAKSVLAGDRTKTKRPKRSVPQPGIEPETSTLLVSRSTTELLRLARIGLTDFGIQNKVLKACDPEPDTA